jgi:hypothetical protein
MFHSLHLPQPAASGGVHGGDPHPGASRTAAGLRPNFCAKFTPCPVAFLLSSPCAMGLFGLQPQLATPNCGTPQFVAEISDATT